jgi:hypothetical protein
VEFITHSIEDGTLHFTVRFKDMTDLSFRYACDRSVMGADFCDFETGDFEMIREPIASIRDFTCLWTADRGSVDLRGYLKGHLTRYPKMALDRDVDIVIRRAPRSRKGGRIRVTAA